MKLIIGKERKSEVTEISLEENMGDILVVASRNGKKSYLFRIKKDSTIVRPMNTEVKPSDVGFSCDEIGIVNIK